MLSRAPARPLGAPAAADPLAAALAALGPAADAALQQRLTALRARVQGPWQLAPPLAPERGETLAGADGRVIGRLWIDGQHLVWQDAQGRTWRAGWAPAPAPAPASAPASSP